MSTPSSSSHSLLTASNAFFDDLALNASSSKLLTHFSTAHLVTIQHAPVSCPRPHRSRFTGLNALRSYLDLLATNWKRSEMRVHSSEIQPELRRAVVVASVVWTWKRSGRSWREDFSCDLEFDEHNKITTFVIATLSGPATCVMRAVDAAADADPVMLNHAALAQT